MGKLGADEVGAPLPPDLVNLVGLEAPPPAQARRLSVLLQVAALVAAEDELDLILRKFLKCLTGDLEVADHALLLIRDVPTGLLKVRAAQGPDWECFVGVEVAAGDGPWSKSLLLTKPQAYACEESELARDVELTEDQRALLDMWIKAGHAEYDCLCLPLVTADRPIGLLELGRRRHSADCVPVDLPLLTAVAWLIAAAIEGTQRRQAQQKAETIEEVKRLKTELVSTLSHEMRTPLTSIKGYSTALLMEEASFDEATQREFLQMIDEECGVLESLVHDLLESSTIDAGLLRLQMELVRLPRVIEGVVSEIARRSTKHHVMVNFSDEFPLVEADPLRVAQVVRNLLDNAIKYSPEGGLIVVRGQVLEEEVVVSVADQGVGIAPEHLNRLFEKGFRVKSGLIRHVAGSGLGLPICLTIVEGHGGRIWAESKLNQGTTLHFTLPRSDLDRRDEPGGT